VGLLALQSAAGPADGIYPLDVLDAESEGMVGYLIEQELGNVLRGGRLVATLLTQVLVDRREPALPSSDETHRSPLRQNRGGADEPGSGMDRC
jgi:carbamate kinase